MNTTLRKQGFTLVEMIVSIGLFTIVLFIATSAFLTVVNADRKSRNVRITADNLNLALEDMQRRVRTGSNYWCGAGGDSSPSVQDCPGSDTTFSFTEQDGTRTTYTLGGTIIKRKTATGSIDVTAPEIVINNLKFLVQGSAIGPGSGGTDKNQPSVVIMLTGSITDAAHPSLSESFNIQTMVTQRNYDI
jgi:prepilin-type N-terminal cleavage/methylation domain-containing protein